MPSSVRRGDALAPAGCLLPKTLPSPANGTSSSATGMAAATSSASKLESWPAPSRFAAATGLALILCFGLLTANTAHALLASDTQKCINEVNKQAAKVAATQGKDIGKCLKNYAKEGDLILDTHVGSASSLIACEDMGFKYIGYELNEDYYKAASKRLQDFINQLKIF